MPDYYTSLVYLWRAGGKIHALMAKMDRWYLVERVLTKRLRLKRLFRVEPKKRLIK